MKKCRECDKLNMEHCYPTSPPKFDCKVTGHCHLLDDVCDVKEEMDKQGKTLSEWTLGEVQALCEKRNGDGCCDGCPFANVIGNCTLRILPEEWDLKESPRLTEPEIAIMRAVGAKWVSRNIDDDDVSLWRERPERVEELYFGSEADIANRWIAQMATELFPSVHPGECIELEECRGAGDGH